jgi:dihydrofolate reductase
MRKVILFMHMSLDGFVSKTNGEMDWVTREDMEMNNYLIGDLLKTVDTMLLGRNLYQGFQQAWPAIATTPSMPKELVDFAHWIEDSPKYVFSKSMNKLDWKNSFLLKGNITEEVKKLQQQPGKDIVVFGGSGIAQQLAKENLIDEYRIKLEPVFLGTGNPLFKDMARLKLIQSKAFSSGVVGLYYQPEKK